MKTPKTMVCEAVYQSKVHVGGGCAFNLKLVVILQIL